MLRHLSVGLIAATFTTSLMCGDAQAASTAKKSTRKASTVTVKKSAPKRRVAHHKSSSYLVPPPPPYSPSILPELAYARYRGKSVKPVVVAEETEEEEVKSSVWEASGHESDKGTQTNKGVMVWNKKS